MIVFDLAVGRLFVEIDGPHSIAKHVLNVLSFDEEAFCCFPSKWPMF